MKIRLKLKLFISCLFFTLYSLCLSAQISIDTSHVIETAKIHYLFGDDGIHSQKEIREEMEKKDNYQILFSQGFSENWMFIFFQTSKRVNHYAQVNEDDHYYGYIIAIDLLTGKAFKLKGFYENEFLQFYSLMKEYEPEKKYKNKTIFISSASIEGLDIHCLYQATIKNNSKAINQLPPLERETYLNRFPCLISYKMLDVYGVY